MNKPNDFYVYALFRPWNGEVCYIGKGRGRRHRRHAGIGEKHYNKLLAHIFAKAKRLNLEVPSVIIRNSLSEEAAFNIEQSLIFALGRRNSQTGPLANLSDGGQGGTSGYTHTVEARAKIGAAAKGNTHLRGRPRSKDATEKATASNRGKKRTADSKARMSASQLGNKNALGVVRSTETRQKMREANLGKVLSPEHRAKLGAAHKGNKYRLGKQHSEETKRKISASKRRANQSDTQQSLFDYFPLT